MTRMRMHVGSLLLGSAGVLKLVLKPDSYTWQFIAVDGRVLDEGRAGPR